MRHDEVRDVTAQMLKEVCHDVTVEPMLLPLQGEHLARRTANVSNEARVDVSARGFWTRGQRAYFDIRIFDPMAHCHRDLTLDAAHRRNEQEKNRAYEERIQNVDQLLHPGSIHDGRRDGTKGAELLRKTRRNTGG